MAIATSQMSMANGSQSDGHNMMVEIRRLLLEVGLQEIIRDDSYDASESGSVDQVPTTTGAYSRWMVFGFSDSHQQNHPVTIRFRVGYRAMGSTGTSYYLYRIQLQVSEGVNDAGGVDGRNFASASGSGYSSNSSHSYLGQGSHAGTFVRYTGDSLTFIFGLKGLNMSSSGRYRVSSFLHLERLRDMNGAVISGFSGIADSDNFSSSTGGAYNTQIYYPSAENSVGARSDLMSRAGGQLGLMEAGQPVIAPLFTWSYTEDKVLPMRRAYSVSKSVLNGNDVLTVTLDFTGEEKKYLIVDPEALGYYPDLSTCAWVFEWE